jgi:hypothetical protein
MKQMKRFVIERDIPQTRPALRRIGLCEPIPVGAITEVPQIIGDCLTLNKRISPGERPWLHRTSTSS